MEKTIVRESKLRNYIASAVISAVVVAFLEFSCTGQVYIPTIFFVSGLSDLKFRALWFLILYNIAFIIPLIVLFLLAAFGLSSEKLYGFMRRRTLFLKIATAIIFLALAVALVAVR
jgi:cytochrome c biogenesis protein CcdA